MIIDGIEQAISLYSFTQRLVERREYGVSDMFAELNSFGISKYELIGSQVFEQYPRPAAREIDADVGYYAVRLYTLPPDLVSRAREQMDLALRTWAAARAVGFSSPAHDYEPLPFPGWANLE